MMNHGLDPAYIQYRQEMMQYVPCGKRREDEVKTPHELILENLRLVPYIAQRYETVTHTLALLDLVQEGNIGLIRAATDYDSKKGLFSVYAGWWIRHYIRLALSKESRSLSLSSDHVRLLRQVRKQLAEEPNTTVEELANMLSISHNEVLDLLNLSQGVLSLNQETREDDEDSSLGDTLEANPEQSPEYLLLAQIERAQVKDILLTSLSPVERRVILWRYGKEKTLEAIAQTLHTDRKQVVKIHDRAIMKMQRYVKVSHLDEIIA